MAHDVFISHSTSDKSIADAVCARLEQHGNRCWIAPRDIVPGQTWPGAITEAIIASRIMVLVVSKSSNGSRPVLNEVESAVGRGVVVIPFRIDDVTLSADMEFFIRTCHWLDAMSPPLEKHLAHLVTSVESFLGKESPPVQAGPTARPPAIGVPAPSPAPAPTTTSPESYKGHVLLTDGTRIGFHSMWSSLSGDRIPLASTVEQIRGSGRRIQLARLSTIEFLEFTDHEKKIVGVESYTTSSSHRKARLTFLDGSEQECFVNIGMLDWQGPVEDGSVADLSVQLVQFGTRQPEVAPADAVQAADEKPGADNTVADISCQEISLLATTNNQLKRTNGWDKYARSYVRWTGYVFDVMGDGSARVYAEKSDAMTSVHSAETATIHLLFREDQMEMAAELVQGQRITFRARLFELKHYGGPNLCIDMDEVSVLEVAS